MDNYKTISIRHGSKALLIVPHQDDEILVAGNLIQHLLNNDVDLYVAYTTNGDWKISAEKRINEALASLEALGIKQDKVFILGYSDCLNTDSRSHIFYHQDDTAVSHSGHSCTYGTTELNDFAYIATGEHSQFNKTNYLRDLELLIESIYPDLIICCDFDQHPDHRMLSLFADIALNKVMKKKPAYRPQVLKRFAYPLAYFAEEDLSAYNNPSTKRPHVGMLKYDFDIIDSFNYIWENRVRIPFVYEAPLALPGKSKVFSAISKHKTQHLISRAASIINDDEVFFEKNTNNLALEAVIEASSGNTAYLNDGLYYNVEDIDAKIPAFTNDRWIPDPSDQKCEIYLRWDSDKSIRGVLLYGAYTDDERLVNISVAFDKYAPLKTAVSLVRGRSAAIMLPEAVCAASCRISFDNIKEEFPGITEIEILPCSDKHDVITQINKIAINDTFSDHYYIGKNSDSVTYDIYTYNNHDEMKVIVSSGDAVVTDNMIRIPDKSKRVVLELKAACSDEVYDRVIITREDILHKTITKCQTVPVKQMITQSKASYRIAIYKEYFKNNSFRSSFKWICGKFINKIPGLHLY